MFLPTPCISSAVMRLFDLWDVVNLFILVYFCLRRSIFQENKPRINLVSKQTNIEPLSRVQMDAILLANNSQHCWMLHVASVCTPCCMLLDVVACYWAKFETGHTFQPTTPNISFVPWSSKRSATMLDPFAQLFQHCWGHARSLRMVYKDLGAVSFPRCTAGPKIVGSCCIRLQTTANTHTTIPNIVGATMLGVVTSVCTQP